MKNRKGFTLVELVTVVFILLVLIFIVIPKLIKVARGESYTPNYEEITYKNIILEENKEKASRFVLDLVSKRIAIDTARETVLRILGTPCIGIQIQNVFIPYDDCNEEQQERIDNWKEGRYD